MKITRFSGSVEFLRTTALQALGLDARPRPGGYVELCLLALKAFFGGTKVRKRFGFSTMIFVTVDSFTPAYLSLGKNTVDTEEYPAPPAALNSGSDAKSDDARM